MKQRENNEIDSLLRVLAGHEQSVSADLAGNTTGAHLDADELSSYAERALPPSTRARYTAHLVDCDDCRKIVTQLSLTAGAPIIEHPGGAQAATSGWRRALLAFFGPPVLRYAMPVALLLFIGVALFVWRQQEREVLVARNEQAEVAKPATLDSGAGATQASPAENFAYDKQQKAGPSATTRTSTANDKTAVEEQKNTPAVASASPTGSNEKESAKKGDVAVAQPAYAPEPPPPAKPANSTMAKDAPRAASSSVEVKDAVARNRESDSSSADARAGAPASAKAPADDKGEGGRKAKTLSGGALASEARRDEASETRSVAGRRFQRRQNVWVDSAFNSSLSVTSVARGSEQFRALIADEPEIGTIAKQLSGEVFLVWKSRAYRIH